MKLEDALARAAPKCIRYQLWTPSSGMVSFGADDIGHALSGLAEAPFKMLLVKYANGGQRDREELHRFLVAELCPENAWWQRRMSSGLIARTAMAEVLSNRVCRTCGGRGAVQKDAKLEICQDCAGCGTMQCSGYERAKALCVSEPTYRRHVAAQYYRAMGIVIGWQHAGIDHLARRLRGHS
jgi:hypothetical protein